jgi:hypothetical protein
MRRPGKSDEQIERIEDTFAQATNDVLARPAPSFDDLVTLAAVACHWNSDPDFDQTYPKCVIDGDPAHDIDRRALAYLVKGVLDLAGVTVDAEGRCKSAKRA